MKEINSEAQDKEIIKEEEEKKNDQPFLISKEEKAEIEPEINPIIEIKNKEKTKEIHNSYFYNIKDYLLFFSLMISSSMNFSYLYYPFTILGIILNFLIGQNNIINKSYKSKIELVSIVYSSVLFIFKIICLSFAINDNAFLSKNKDIFLDLGICYLRNNHTSFFFYYDFFR